MPIRTSLRPTVNGPSAITRQSQSIARTRPPAGQWPSIAAATGSGDRASAAIASNSRPMAGARAARSGAA